MTRIGSTFLILASGATSRAPSSSRNSLRRASSRCGLIATQGLTKRDESQAAIEIAKQQVEDGAMVLDFNVDDGMVDGVAAMGKLLRIAVTEPDVAKVWFFLGGSKVIGKLTRRRFPL